MTPETENVDVIPDEYQNAIVSDSQMNQDDMNVQILTVSNISTPPDVGEKQNFPVY